MTVPKLAIHAGSLPAAPTIVPVCQIGPHSHRQSGRAPSDPRVCTNTDHRPPSQSDRVDRSRPTSFRPTLRPIPHSACCTLRALPTAISCLGAFRTPAAGARGWHRGCRRPKTCTIRDIGAAAPLKTLLSPQTKQRYTRARPQRGDLDWRGNFAEVIVVRCKRKGDHHARLLLGLDGNGRHCRGRC